MTKFRLAILTAALCLWQLPAHAQTPQQIQGLIASGQEQTALSDLQSILQAHPHSGVAWYLTAEAQDAAGNESAARTALANAQQYAPGLPFANPTEIANLQAHLAGAPATDTPAPSHHGISPLLLVIGGFVILFLFTRLLFRRRRAVAMYPNGYGQGMPMRPGTPFYGQGGYPPPAQGGGLGGSLLGGLAAGAGFAAGERIIDDVIGGGADRDIDPNQNIDPNYVPDRDDGLSGSPGWDAGNNSDDSFDPNNNW
jgi:hypothetical protein